jgi:hypothetical protein
MGLALLPWEKLPAYVFGPLLFALNGWLLWIDADRTFGSVVTEAGCMAFALFLVWHRCRTGKELFANEPPKPDS